MDSGSVSGCDEEGVRMNYTPNIQITQDIVPKTPDESDDSDGDMKSLFNIMTPHHVPGRHKVKNYAPLEASITEKASVTRKIKTESFEILTMGDENKKQRGNKDVEPKNDDVDDFLDGGGTNKKSQEFNPCDVEDINLVTLEPKEEFGKDNLVGRNDLGPVNYDEDRETLQDIHIINMEDEQNSKENQKQNDEGIVSVTNFKEEHSEYKLSSDSSEPQLGDIKLDLEEGNDNEDKNKNHNAGTEFHVDKENSQLVAQDELLKHKESQVEKDENEQEKLLPVNMAKHYLSACENEQEVFKRCKEDIPENQLEDNDVIKEINIEKREIIVEEKEGETVNAFSKAGHYSLDDAMDIKDTEMQTRIVQTDSVETKEEMSLDTILVTDSMMADISMQNPAAGTIHDSSSLDFSIIDRTASMYKVGDAKSDDEGVKQASIDMESEKYTENEGVPRYTNEIHSDSEDDHFESADEGEKQEDNVNKGKDNLEGSVIVIHDDSEDESDKFKTSFTGLLGSKLQKDLIKSTTPESNENSTGQELVDDYEGTPKNEIENKSSESSSQQDISANPIDFDKISSSISSRASSSSSIIILGSSVRGQYNSISSQLQDENLSDSVVILDEKEDTRIEDHPLENTGRDNPDDSFNSKKDYHPEMENKSMKVYHNDFESDELETNLIPVKNNSTSIYIAKDPEDAAKDGNDDKLDIPNQNERAMTENISRPLPSKSLVVYESMEDEKLYSEKTQIEKDSDDHVEVGYDEELDTAKQNEPSTSMDIPPPVPPKSMAVYQSIGVEKLSSEQPIIPPKDYPSLQSRQSINSFQQSFNQPVSGDQNCVPTPEIGQPDYPNYPPLFNAGPQQPQSGQPYDTQQQFPPYYYPYTNHPLTAEQQQQYSMYVFYWQMAHQFQQYNQAMPTAPPQTEFSSFSGGHSGAGPQQWQQPDGQQPRNFNAWASTTAANQTHTSFGQEQQTHLPYHQDVKSQKSANDRETGGVIKANKGRKDEMEPNVRKIERKSVKEAPNVSSRSNANTRALVRPDQSAKDQARARGDDRHVIYARESNKTETKRGTSAKDLRKKTGNEANREPRPKSDTGIPVPVPRKRLAHDVSRNDQKDSAKPKRDDSKSKPTEEKKNEKPPEPERKEWYLLVNNLNQNASLENLINYLEIGLEEREHVIADNVIHDQECGRAVVVFSEKPDTKKLFNKLSTRKFEGGHLTCQEISPPTHIAFSCEEPIRNPESLENYFEIPRIGGGVITQPLKESEDGSCYIVGFEDVKVVERLCTRLEPHKFDSKELRVTPCYTFEGGAIWDHKTHTIPKAEPIEVTPPPEHLRYLKRCCFEELKTQVEVRNGLIEMDAKSVKITCTLTPKVPGFKTLIRAWTEDMRTLVEKFIEQKISQKTISLDQEIDVWSRLLSCVSLIDETDLNVIQNHSDCVLVFTGHPDEVGKKYNETTEKIQAVRRKLRRTSERKKFRASRLAVVEAIGAIDEIRNELDDTVITLQRETVEVEGQREDINEVYSKIYEKIDALVCEDSPSHEYSVDCVQFINNDTDIIKKIDDAIEGANMTARWELKRNELVIYYPRGHDPQKISKLIFRKIAESKIDLDREMIATLSSDEWMQFSQDQTEAFTDVRHDHIDRAMVVYGYAESVTVVADNIKTFLEETSVRSVAIKVEQVKVEFMEQYKHESKKITEIERRNEQYNVCIQLKETRKYKPELLVEKAFSILKEGSIEIMGKKKGIEAAKRDLQKLANEITSEKYEIKKIGVQDVFANEKQKGTIKTIEKETCCLIKSPFDEVSTPVYSSRFSFDDNYSVDRGATGGYDSTEEDEETLEYQTDNRTYKCKNGITIRQVEGEIGRESADVLAATCDRNLDLKLGGASRSLLTCAGTELQTELSNDHQEISHGELVILNSYNLECSKVFLTSLPNWSQNGGCMQLVQKFMTECLKALARMRKRSIVFTAMGTGQLNFPAGQVAQVMYQTVIDFDKNSPNTSVEEVEFIMYHKDVTTIRAFKEELKALKDGGGIHQTYAIQMTNIHVEIVVEDIAAQKVDAILCSSSDNFDLSKSGAAAALLKVGGKALQDGANAFKQTGISKGHVGKIGSVGNLPCKAVFLTVLPSYSQDNASALSDSIKAFLNSCHFEKRVSVAIPAMGSGFLKYPKPIVSRTMFEAVQQWATKTPNSSIKSVKFVMYAKDYEVIDAFKAKIKSLQGSSARKGRQLERSTLKDGELSKKFSMFDSGCNIGPVILTVTAGDIVTEKADAIVSSLGKPCEFLGAVSQSLLQKCPNMKKAVEKKKSNLEKNGMISTNTAGGIPAGKVIHIHFQDKLDDWQKLFSKCLEKANNKKFKSIAFPVLGTGQGYMQFPPQDIAGALFDAVNEFAFKNKTRSLRLKDVRLVIFHKQQAMKDPIVKALSQKVNDCTKTSKGLFGKMKGGLNWMKDKIMGTAKQPIPQARVDEASCVEVTIYSDSKGNIDKCKKELDKRLDANYLHKKIDNYAEIVKGLSQDELKLIENTTGFIDIKIDQPQGIISLYGPSRTVSNVDSEIQRKLIAIERNKRTAKEAKTLYDLVKWHHEEVTLTAINLVAYDEKVNLMIENAYKENKPLVRLKDSSGDVYIIDFVKMVEYLQDDPNDEVKVMRKDIIKGGDAMLPKEWVPMGDNENIKVINLQPTDSEYKTVESTFVKGAQNGAFTNRIPNVAGLKVTKIERIQNKTLYQQYVAKKKQMQGEKPQLPANMPLERTLWHGTAQAAVASIQRHGFNRSYSGKNGTWFGAGVYFAADASYSARPWLAIGQQNPPLPAGQNKGYIFMCKVLTGQYTQGNQSMRYLPPVDVNKSKTLMFDCAVDKLANPVEFVIFHDTQAYPEYIITFTL